MPPPPRPLTRAQVPAATVPACLIATTAKVPKTSLSSKVADVKDTDQSGALPNEEGNVTNDVVEEPETSPLEVADSEATNQVGPLELPPARRVAADDAAVCTTLQLHVLRWGTQKHGTPPRHIDSKHTKEKGFGCMLEGCGSAFTRKDELWRY